VVELPTGQYLLFTALSVFPLIISYYIKNGKHLPPPYGKISRIAGN
jgi:hypothetical protein